MLQVPDPLEVALQEWQVNDTNRRLLKLPARFQALVELLGSGDRRARAGEPRERLGTELAKRHKP